MKVCFEGLHTETLRNFSEIKIFRKLASDCNRLIVSTNTYVDLAYTSRKSACNLTEFDYFPVRCHTEVTSFLSVHIFPAFLNRLSK